MRTMTPAEHTNIAHEIAHWRRRAWQKLESGRGPLAPKDFDRYPNSPERREWARLRNHMALANRGLVYMVAKKYRYPRSTQEDIVQWGFLGLLKAIDRFNPNRGRFSTYAVHWIRNEIQRHAARLDRVIRVPVGVRVLSAKAYRLHGQGLSPVEIAHHLGVTMERLEYAIGLMQMPVDGDIEVAHREDPVTGIDGDRRLERLSIAMRHLSAYDRALLHERFVRERTLADIAREQGYSRELIRQRMGKALEKMKGMLKKNAQHP